MSINESITNTLPRAVLVTHIEDNSIQPKGDITMDIENDIKTIDFAYTPSAQAATATAIAKASCFQQGVPSGYYPSKIRNVNRTTHSDGYDVVRVLLEVSSGAHARAPLAKFYNLKTKKSVQFFRREMNEIGELVSTRDELDGLCNSLAGKSVVAQVADHPSGNQVIFLKGSKSNGSSVDVCTDALWT